jgi:uncharacterized protein YndB with AHSA1/START domain
MPTTPNHVFQTYIRCTPQRLWEAITDGSLTQQYFHGTVVESDWAVGSPIIYRVEGGEVGVAGEVLECDPPRRLVTTWHFSRVPQAADEPPSQVTWEVEETSDGCRLTLIHDHFDGETFTYESVGEGWPQVLSSLKSLLETGRGLDLFD